jgi:hypothetical protein
MPGPRQPAVRRRTGPLLALGVAAVAVAATGCGSTSSDDGDGPGASDPATFASDCERLVGPDGLVERALAFGDEAGLAPADPEGDLDSDRLEVQDELFTVVSEGDDSLADPVGQLVDFLDDPQTYSDDEDLMEEVRGAAGEIEDLCAGS